RANARGEAVRGATGARGLRPGVRDGGQLQGPGGPEVQGGAGPPGGVAGSRTGSAGTPPCRRTGGAAPAGAPARSRDGGASPAPPPGPRGSPSTNCSAAPTAPEPVADPSCHDPTIRPVPPRGARVPHRPAATRRRSAGRPSMDPVVVLARAGAPGGRRDRHG